MGKARSAPGLVSSFIGIRITLQLRPPKSIILYVIHVFVGEAGSEEEDLNRSHDRSSESKWALKIFEKGFQIPFKKLESSSKDYSSNLSSIFDEHSFPDGGGKSIEALIYKISLNIRPEIHSDPVRKYGNVTHH
ncbi:hypothetical protein AYI70_g2727 [Smittium culicis]|uniref:Uncharacterized protein n=1 Tax=Smittium culicis TaxID=133412 RepID=A0A1R1Y6Q1_9FUNG|nr:hypothetical protein AYI70_g2727 [Smittium culicis]